MIDAGVPFAPPRKFRRGVSLIEALIAIPFVGMVLVAALNSVGASRVAAQKASLHDEANRLAESLLGEILLLPYEDADDEAGPPGPTAEELDTGNRSKFNDINDYNAWVADPPQLKNGDPVPNANASRFRERVKVIPFDPTTFALTGGADLGLMRVSVEMFLDDEPLVTLTRYRTRGLPKLEGCCMPDQTCRDLPPSDCTAQSGRPGGSDTRCATTECSGPVAHWKFDEGAGTLADDSAGLHDATLLGPTWTGGHLGGALRFLNNYANVPHRDTLSLSNELTITAWISKGSLIGYDTIVFKGQSGSVAYYLQTYGNKLVFGFYSGGWVEFFSPSPSLLRNRWYHVAVTYNAVGRTVTMYVDGVLAGTNTLTPPTMVPLPINTAALTIGKSYLGEYWDGMLDDVRIYDTVLNAADIVMVMNGDDSSSGPAPTSALLQGN